MVEEQKHWQVNEEAEGLEQVENDLDSALLLRDMSPVKDEEMLNLPANTIRSSAFNNREDNVH